MMTTAAAAARVIADAGIERVFGLPGGEVLVLIDELRKASVDFVLMRHEANAGIAAAVYGKLRGQPGVVLATLGPGAANLMLPIANAFLDQEPLVAISAQIPGEFPASHTHQLPAAARRLPADREVCRGGHGRHGERRRAARPRGLRRAAVRRVVSHAVGARSREADAGGGRSRIERCGRHDLSSRRTRARSRGRN